jgi:hypothetical protein
MRTILFIDGPNRTILLPTATRVFMGQVIALHNRLKKLA